MRERKEGGDAGANAGLKDTRAREREKKDEEKREEQARDEREAR